MVQIAALVLPGVFMSSLAPLTDAFHLTVERGERMLGAEPRVMPDFRLSLVSPDGADLALGRHGLLRVDQPIASSDRFDFVWIPAFRAHGEAQLRARLAAARPVLDWLRAAAANGAVIGASGAAVTLPLAARLADRLPVPVADPLLPVVRALFPRFHHAADMTVADHGNLLLSRGIGHDVQAITAVFSRIFSPESGRWISSVFGGETPAAEPGGQPGGRDPVVVRARLMLEQRFSAPVSVAEVAAELCVSHAVLIRRFRRELGVTPSGYVQQLRLGAAQRMLLNSDRPVETVAAAVGFGDARLLRELFRKATGQSATEWRRAARQHERRAMSLPGVGET